MRNGWGPALAPCPEISFKASVRLAAANTVNSCACPASGISRTQRNSRMRMNDPYRVAGSRRGRKRCGPLARSSYCETVEVGHAIRLRPKRNSAGICKGAILNGEQGLSVEGYGEFRSLCLYPECVPHVGRDLGRYAAYFAPRSLDHVIEVYVVFESVRANDIVVAR